MRSRMMAVLIGLCLIGLAGGASAQTQINIAAVTNPDFVHTKASFWFKECVEKAAPGKLSVVVPHSASLGSETQVLQKIQLGTTQMSVCTTAPIEAFVPEIKALEMPFVFPTYEAADRVLDGPIGQELAKKFEKSGFVALAFLALSRLNGVAVQDVARELDIHPFMLSRWRKQAREGRIVAKRPKLDEQTTAQLKELRELKKQHKRLQLEHEILKKAIRFSSERKQRSSNSWKRTEPDSQSE